MPNPITGQSAGRPSGLPQQIPPQTAEFGNLQIGADGKPTGRVIIDINWWLFFLNISKNVLSAPGSPIPIVNVATALTLADDLTPLNPQPATVIDWMGPV